MPTDLLKYCLYYDGTEKSIQDQPMAFYEKCWIIDSENGHPMLKANVKEMLAYGIEEEWMDQFGVPHTYICVFFNRYCHFGGPINIEDFKKWFTELREGKMK